MTISNYDNDITLSDDKIPADKKIERIASLDFQRGLAIFIMVFIHAAANIIDSSYIEEDPTIIADLPVYILILFAILGFFGIWNSYFLFISVTVNSYSMTKGMIHNHNAKKILVKQIATGIGLIIVNHIQDIFFGSGYFGEVMKTGVWSNTFPLWNGFFCMGTLRIIGMCMIINSLLLYFLLRKGGIQKFIRNITIFGVLAVIIIVSSEFVNSWVDNLNWTLPSQLPAGVELAEDIGWPDQTFQALNASIKSFFCVIISGDIEPLFPYLATGFIGAIIGLCLAQPEKVKRLNTIGGLLGLVFMIIGGVFVALGFFNFGNLRPPIGNYLVMLGGQLCVFFLLLWLVEYRGKAKKFGNNPIVKHFRLWGMLSLTLFTIDILEILPRMIFGFFYNMIYSTNFKAWQGPILGSGQEYLAIIYAIFAIVFYEIVVYLWSKLNFFLSFEWMIVKSVGLVTRKKSKRLDVKLMMDNVSWISFENIHTNKKEISKKT